MAKLFVVDNTGASAVDLVDARARFDEANIDAFGASLDTTTHAPQNQIAGINALIWTEIGEDLLRAALWGASPSYAQGIYLDSLGGLLDIRREQETFTRVNATLTGAAGTSVPAGSLARTIDGAQFRLLNDVVLQTGGTAGVFVAVESGPVECGANELTGVVSVLSGWSGVSNDQAGVIGRVKETDAEYRANILARTAQSSIGSLGALRSALTAAGATSTKVIENSTTASVTSGGVTLPAHSIFVMADGGLADDVGRAVENHRGMGVGTYSAIVGRSTTLANVQQITNGRLRWNGTDITSLDFSTDTLTEVASELGAASTSLTMAASNDQLLAFHDYTPSTLGFEDIGGNYAQSDGILQPFGITESAFWRYASGLYIRLLYSENFASNTQTAPVISYTLNGADATLDNTGATANRGGPFIIWNVPTALPAGATNIRITIKNIANSHTGESSAVDYVVTREETADSTEAPALPVVFGTPQTTQIRIWGYAFGTITKWQYRRFENGAYIDSSWVDLTGTRQVGWPSAVNITGFTAGLGGSRVDLRAVNGSHGTTQAVSIPFDSVSTAPTITASAIDGRAISLTASQKLIANYHTGTPISNWTISKSGVNVVQQRIRGDRIYLLTNTPVSATDTGLTLSYAVPGSDKVSNTSQVDLAAFTNRALTNNTLAGVPAAPVPVLVFQTASNMRVDWVANSNGGQTIDRYEYQTSTDNGNTWSVWQSAGTSTTLTLTDSTPDLVRVRASNINARAAEILGLSDIAPSPFMRSVPRRLIISVGIGSQSNLSGNDLTLIKDALINRVNQYESGDTLRLADLRSEIERLPGVAIDTLTITSDGAAVDGVAQNTYNRWSLARTDITLSFA